MSNKFIVHFESVRKEVKNYPIVYILLSIILFFAIFARVYNVSNNLGFYFDQGRDAMVIWNFWKNGNIFLIGPTTGIAGIFRGPWYYGLITPFYISGQGDPVFPAVFLSLTTVLAIFFLFLIAKELVNREAGLIAATIAAFSYYIVVHSRWLSNPAPMLLISTLLLWTMIQISKRSSSVLARGYGEAKWVWPAIGFLVGMAIQFGSATEIFYIPTVLIFAIWNRKQSPPAKIIILSIGLFFVSFIPQILFDLSKGGVLSKAVVNFLVKKESFKLSLWEVLGIRLNQYKLLYTSLLLPGDLGYLLPFVLGGFWIILAKPRIFIRNHKFKILAIFISLPLFGMLFFQGNYGNVFDYYFSGLYFPLILFFSLPLGYIAKNWGGKLAVITFFLLFFKLNTPVLENYMLRGRTHFTFNDQKKAVEWVYKNAKDENFNVDVYVPPVIPYAYDYLFRWYSFRLGQDFTLVEDQVPLLYTIYELDPPNPQRLDIWLARQETIGKVEEEFGFGGITAQRRKRLQPTTNESIH